MLALVVASRFGMLLGLALWLGLGAGLLLVLPTVSRHLADEPGRALTAALVARFDRLLLVAVALVLLGLGARILIDRTAPPTSLVIPVAVMTLSRVLSVVSDRLAFARARWQGARGLLQSLEVCLGLYALYAIS